MPNYYKTKFEISLKVNMQVCMYERIGKSYVSHRASCARQPRAKACFAQARGHVVQHRMRHVVFYHATSTIYAACVDLIK